MAPRNAVVILVQQSGDLPLAMIEWMTIQNQIYGQIRLLGDQ